MKKENKKSLKKFKIEHWKVISIYLLIYDIIAINFANIMALLLRFDLGYSNIPKEYLNGMIMFAPFLTIATVCIFSFMHLYSSLWRFASFNELNRIIVAWIGSTLFNIIGMNLFVQVMPISYYIVGSIIFLCAITGIRFSYRYISLIRNVKLKKGIATNNVMIIGAGSAGQVIVKELKVTDKNEDKPVCFIDDNPNKWGRYMEGIPVVGGRNNILQMVEKYNIDTIMFAIPSAKLEDKRTILNICNQTECKLVSLPALYELSEENGLLNKLKPVDVADLLGRKPIKINTKEVFREITDKVILVTGGGGSIGSELCRQIARHAPKCLIIFDIYENNAYDIEQELKRKQIDLNLITIIGSVRDKEKLNSIFDKYRPDIVFHAAAHKHVPLMETSPCEAIKNNAIGTYNTAYSALKYGTKRFVLVSTDKAVNPTNIMGASKRLCEMIIQSMDFISRNKRKDLLKLVSEHIGVKREYLNIFNDKEETTRYVAVRFGNVLGSNGSVIPLFKKQIEAGGPVTVTHPDIIRYFMTIPEAVSLILQAETYAKGGEIFVLDMGVPVKIDTLARNLIRLSGFIPDEEIKIEYTGLRPGEKIFEEKLMDEEGMTKTDNGLIYIGKPIPFRVEKFIRDLKHLDEVAKSNSDDIIEETKKVVKTFNPVGKNPTGNEHSNSKELKKQKMMMEDKIKK